MYACDRTKPENEWRLLHLKRSNRTARTIASEDSKKYTASGLTSDIQHHQICKSIGFDRKERLRESRCALLPSNCSFQRLKLSSSCTRYKPDLNRLTMNRPSAELCSSRRLDSHRARKFNHLSFNGEHCQGSNWCLTSPPSERDKLSLTKTVKMHNVPKGLWFSDQKHEVASDFKRKIRLAKRYCWREQSWPESRKLSRMCILIIITNPSI
jgi:hypothetical protein